MALPFLIATAHGTDNSVGQRIITSLVDQTRALLPDVTTLETYVDVQQPQINEVLETSGHNPAVIVPLLLSTGYHTRHDIQGAATQRQANGIPTQATTTLGPDSALADIQLERIRSVCEEPGHVIMVVAGSSDSLAQHDAEAQRALLEDRFTNANGGVAVKVSVAYLSAAEPTVPQALEKALHTTTGPIVLNAYLLAPGFFQTKLRRLTERFVKETGTDAVCLVTEPLGDDARIAEIIARRYTEQLATSTELLV